MTKTISISFASLAAEPQASTVIYFVPEGNRLPVHLQDLDAKTQGAIRKATEFSGFRGKRKTTLEMLAPHGLKASRLILAGVGPVDTLKELEWTIIGGALRGKLPRKIAEADVVFAGVGEITSKAPLDFLLGFDLRNYSFRKYKTKAEQKEEPDESRAEDESGSLRLTIYSPFQELTAEAEKVTALGKGVCFARDLVNEPANILTPPEFTERLRALESKGLKIKILDERMLKTLGMNALLAVGRGSSQPTSAVIIQWEGPLPGPADQDQLVFIGKGVRFDTGGLSMKPAQGMEDMKGDMAGAAAVAGVMLALAERKAPVHAVGLVGLVENMPSGTSIHPGDIVTSASGQTIEILNTDAEGRLVLADLLWYAQNHLKPKLMITLATLTGAILVALGKENAGLFANDDELAAKLSEAGREVGETVWRLPLSKTYNKMIDSKIADMKNIGGREAGSITAAQFLLRFVKQGIPWAHLDIAGTAMGSPASDINTSWASGYGVRLLDRFSEKYFET